MTNLPDGWVLTPLNKFMQRERREVDVKQDELYYQIGIRSHGLGIFHKEPVTGEEIGGKRIYWLEPGDFVLNIVFAWEGAVALISENERGMVGSHRFPTFVIDDSQCDSRFLLRHFKTKRGIHQLGLVSPGGAGRNKTLSQADFLKLKIALPSLNEQHTIADILDTWDDAITLAERLIAALQARKRGLMQRLLTGAVRFTGYKGEDWPFVPVHKIATVNPRRSREIIDDEMTVSFIGMAGVSEEARVTNTEIRQYGEVRSGFTAFQDRDVLIAKITPCLENGKGALVTGLENGMGFGSTEFHVVRADEAKVTPEYLYYHTITH